MLFITIIIITVTTRDEIKVLNGVVDSSVLATRLIFGYVQLTSEISDIYLTHSFKDLLNQKSWGKVRLDKTLLLDIYFLLPNA